MRMQKFREEVVKAIEKATGHKVTAAELSAPPNPAMGDLASNIAFKLGGNPKENAEKLAKQIKPAGLIREVKAAGPFLNFFADRKKLAKQVIAEILKEGAAYGKGAKKKEKVMVEYSQPNTHKAFHVGHIRGTALGFALSNILQHYGYDVVKANYQGDTGAHVAKCLWCMQKFHKGEEPKDNKGKWLASIYAEANQKIAENPEFEDEYKQTFHKLFFDKDPALVKLWKATRQWSLDEFEKIYKELGVSFDVNFFESEVEEEGVAFAKELERKGIAHKDAGALIMDLGEPLGVFLVLRSDGTALYSTKDIILAKRKFEEFKIDTSIYITAAEQKLYFAQLFEALKRMGFKQAEKCVHIPFGLVVLPEGKMKSREGRIVFYEDLAAEAKRRVLKEIEAKNPELKDKDGVAQAVGIGALKYWMLHTSNNKDIVFEWERALDFNGETGPYVQYALVRCRGILEKSEKEPSVGEVDAHDLVVELAAFPEAVEKAALEHSPHLMAQYAYRVADKLNHFYVTTPVIGSENEAELLALVKATETVLENTLRLLGIGTPGKM